MSQRVRGLLLQLFGVAFLGLGACADDPIVADRENIFAYPSDAGLLAPDLGADADDVSRRDAVVRVTRGGGSGCGGILISPRVVVSAAHCGHPTQVRFHQFWETAGETANVVACFVHPRALNNPANPVRGCDDPRLNPFNTNRTAYDWEVLILDRRVDASRYGTSITATPASVPLSVPTELSTGTALVWASAEHVAAAELDAGTDAGLPYLIDPSRGRVAAGVSYGATSVDTVLGDAFGPFTFFLDDTATEYFSVEFGDSGSPFYYRAPGTGAVTLVSLTTRSRGVVAPGADAGPTIGPGFDAGVGVLWNPNVRGTAAPWDVADFLGPFIDCSRAADCRAYVAPGAGHPRGHRIFVGPTDRPYSGDPARLLTDDGPDPDGDGLDDSTHDLCPGVFDPDQLDTDNDGLGDACDNCPQTNPLQTDCNLDAEDQAQASELPGRPNFVTCPAHACLATQFCAAADSRGGTNQRACSGEAGCFCLTRRLGDLCDPTPCGLTLEDEQITLDPSGGGRISQPSLRVDARSAIRATDRGSTGFRICPCADAARDDEATRQQCAIAGCTLNDPVEYHLALVDGRERVSWRFITTDDGSGPTHAGRYDVPYDPIGSDGEFVSDSVYRTSVVPADTDRWAGDPRFVGVFPLPLATPPMFNAVLWTHTATFGAPSRTSTIACGDGATSCTDPRCAGTVECLTTAADVEAIASHYISRAVVAPITIAPPTAIPCVHAVGPVVGDGACPYCAGFFPELYFGFVGTSFDPQCENIGDIVGTIAGPLAIPGSTLHIPIFDPAIFDGSGFRWVSAAESTAWLGETGLRYISLDAANVPATIITAELGKLEAVPASQACPNGCIGHLAPTDASPGPPPLLPGAAYVLSATRGRLYIVGGDAPTGPVSSISAFVMGRGWVALPSPSTSLGHVLATTYSPHWDALVVLDEHVDHHRRLARLLRIDPESGASEVLGEWPRGGATSRFAMSAGTDDQLFIASSGPAAHQVVRFDANGSPTGIVAGLGALTEAPIHASTRGLSVVIASRRGPQTIGYEWSRFRPEARMAERSF